MGSIRRAAQWADLHKFLDAVHDGGLLFPDELTLEMMTNEERDYMYYAYASDPSMRLNLGIRRRLAPL